MMKVRVAAGIAFAVFAAVIIGILAFGFPGGGEDENNGEIRFFDDYGQIQKVLNSIKKQEPFFYANDGVEIIEDEMAETPGPMSGTGGAAKESQHSDTYVQVEGVDEADIIKTDGKYIYYTSRLGYDVIVARVNDGKAEDAAVIAEEETGITADDLFLSEDRLVIVGAETEEPDSYYVPSGRIKTTVCVYDVSDPEKPVLTGKYSQSGSCVSSRVSDGYLYLITSDYLEQGGQRIVPMAGVDDSYEKLVPDHICCFPDPSRRSYAVIGSVKLDSGKGSLKSDTFAALGTSEDIYCSGSSIYLTDYRVNFGNEMSGPADQRTYVIKAKISKGRIAFAKQGSVRGDVLNQFAMDEKDGYFRIATTAYVKGKDVNYLYVLDRDMKVVGKVKGFAAGEQIKAVRYIGDTAYVITYEQTDPLFVIDLSDPENPQMKGSVKITGFSSLLLPEGEDKLIGIGTSTSDGEFGEVEDGVKIALFDISDPENPKVLDSMTYRDYSSEVQYNHKALTVNRDEGWYAVPFSVWSDDTGGVLQFRVSGSKLEEMAKHESKNGIERCLYINDYIYGLDSFEDEIISWKSVH